MTYLKKFVYFSCLNFQRKNPTSAFGEFEDFSKLEPEKLTKLEEIINVKDIPSVRTDEKFFEDHLRYWNERPQRIEKLDYLKK